jgi:hypothetical protein
MQQGEGTTCSVIMITTDKKQIDTQLYVVTVIISIVIITNIIIIIIIIILYHRFPVPWYTSLERMEDGLQIWRGICEYIE